MTIVLASIFASLLIGVLIMKLDALTAAVAANTAATQAAVAALGSGSTDQAAIDAAAVQIATNTNALINATPLPAPPTI